MKPVVVVVGLFVMLAVHVTADLEVLKKAIVKCKDKTGISDDAIKNMNPNKVPPTQNELCYMGCMNHELGFVFPNNTINVEQVKLMYAGLKEKHPDFYQKSIKVTEICASKVAANSDDCAAAKILMECDVDEKKKIGLEMPEH